MLISYAWLQTYFKKTLPSPDVLSDALMMRAFEVEGAEKIQDDTVFDIKTLLTGLQKNGMMATQAGSATLRLTPPLILSETQAHEALEIIEKTLQEL